MDFTEIDKSLAKSHDEGYTAYGELHQSIFENPYEPGSLNFDAWNSGWKLAKEDYYEYLNSNSPLREEDY